MGSVRTSISCLRMQEDKGIEVRGEVDREVFGESK